MTDIEWVMFTAPRFAKHLWKGWKDPLACNTTESRWVLEKWINVNWKKLWWKCAVVDDADSPVSRQISKSFKEKDFIPHHQKKTQKMDFQVFLQKWRGVFFSHHFWCPSNIHHQAPVTQPASCSLDCQWIRTSQKSAFPHLQLLPLFQKTPKQQQTREVLSATDLSSFNSIAIQAVVLVQCASICANLRHHISPTHHWNISKIIETNGKMSMISHPSSTTNSKKKWVEKVSNKNPHHQFVQQKSPNILNVRPPNLDSCQASGWAGDLSLPRN